ncbi:hypothetical protein MIDIC_10016 [Alphaproteobacteria bacterium]
MGEKQTKNNFKAVFPWLIKEEIISKTNAKISDYMMKNIDEAAEKKEFNKYVLNQTYLEDGDIYGIKRWVSTI